MKTFVRLVLCSGLVAGAGLAPARPAWANACTAVATGNWGTTGTWTSCGGTTPQSTDTVTIGTNYTVTLDGSSPTIQGLTLGDSYNGKLIIKNSKTLTVTNATATAVNILSTGTLELGDSSATTAAGTLTLSANGGGLTSAGTIIDYDASLINLKGDWTNSGTHALDDSTVTFNRSNADQAITSGANGDFWNLTLNNTGAAGSDDINLQDALDVNGTLTITDGDLTPGANAITLAGSLSIGTSGAFTKGGTFTFDGTTPATWADSSTGGPKDLGSVTINKTDTSAPATNDKVSTNTSAKATSVTVGGADSETHADTLDISGDTLTLTGSGTPLTIRTGATFTDNTSSTVAFAATSGTVTVNGRTYGGNLTVGSSGSPTFNAGGNIAVTGNLNVSAGTLDMGPGANNYTMTVNTSSASYIDGTYYTGTAKNSFGNGSGDSMTVNGTFYMEVPDASSSTYFSETGSWLNNYGSNMIYTGCNAGSGAILTTIDPYYNLTVNSASCNYAYSAAAAITVNNDLRIISGTLTLSATMTVNNNNAGDLDGSTSLDGVRVEGTLALNNKSMDVKNSGSLRGPGSVTCGTCSGGTVNMQGTGQLGETGAIYAFANVDIGTATVDAATTLAGTIDMHLALTIVGQTSAPGNVLNAESATLNLSKAGTGSGRPLVLGSNGTFNEDTSTVVYVGTGTTTVENLDGSPADPSASSDYYNLRFEAQGPFNLGGQVGVANNFTIGVATATVDVTTNNYGLFVKGTWSNSAGAFTARSGTVTFNGTAANKQITAGSSAFYNLIFNGSGGEWELQSATTTVNNDLTVTAGTLSLNNKNLTVSNTADDATDGINGAGTIYCDADGVNMATDCTAGTVTVSYGGDTLGDPNGNYNFYHLTFPASLGLATTQTGSFTVYGDLNVLTYHTLIGGSYTITLAGTDGSPFSLVGTFTANGSTVEYTGNYASGNTTVAATTYNHLTLNNGSEIYDAGGTVTANGTLTVQAGTFAVGANTVTGGSVTVSGGTLSIGSGGVLKLASGGALSMTSGTLLTADEVTAPVITTSGTEGTNFYSVQLQGGTVNVQELAFRSVSTTSLGGNYGNVHLVDADGGTALTISNFNKVSLGTTGASTPNFQTSGNNDALLNVTAQTVSLANLTFPAAWSGGECNIRANASGTITVNSFTGAFGGETHECENGGVINWPGLVFSGTVYSDEGTTRLSGGPTVSIKVNGAGTYTGTASNAGCPNSPCGYYAIGDITAASGAVVTVFLDTGGGASATTVTRSAGASISGLDLWQNRFIVQHEDAGPITNTNLGQYDKDNDTDIHFTSNATTFTCDGDASFTGLCVDNNTELHVATGKTFTPGSAVKLASGGSSPGGDLHVIGTLSMQGNNLIVNGGDLTGAGIITQIASGTTTLGASGNVGGGTYTFYNLNIGTGSSTVTTTAAGNLSISGVLTIVSSSGTNTFDASSRTITLSGTSGAPFVINAEVFTASTSTVEYTGANGAGNTTVTATTYNHLTLNNVSEDYVAGGAIITSGDLTLSAGTFNMGGNDLTVNGGDLTTDYETTFTQSSSGTTTVKGTSTAGLGGTNSTTTFYNLTIGDGSTSSTIALAGAVTVTNDLDIPTSSGTNKLLLAGQNLTVGGGDFTNAETVNCGTIGAEGTCSAGTVTMKGTSATGLGGAGTTTLYNLTIGDGSTSSAVDLAGTVTVSNDVAITDTSGTNSLSLNGKNLTVSGGDLAVPTGEVLYCGNGNNTCSAGTVTVTGSSATGIGGAGTTTVYTLSIGDGSTSSAVDLAGTVTVSNDVTLTDTSGTNSLSLNGKNLTVSGGDLAVPTGEVLYCGNGNDTCSAGTVTIAGTGSVGGAGTTTFYHLNVGTNTSAVTTTAGGALTIKGTLTVDTTVGNLDTFDASSRTITLAGTGTLLEMGGQDRLTEGTSTFVYTHGTSATVTATTYNNLQFNGNGTYTLGTGAGQTITIGGDLVMMMGIVDADAHDPNINIGGTLSIALGSYTTGSGTMTFTGTSKTITDSLGMNNLGAVMIDGTIATDTGVKMASVTINNTKSLDISSDTLTLTGSGAPLTVNGTLTTTNSTVKYTGSSPTISLVPSYNTLEFANTGTAVIPAGTLTAVNFTLTSGAVTASGNPDINLSGNLSLAAGTTYTKGSGTTTFTGTAAKTWTDSTATKQDLGAVTINKTSATESNNKITLGSSVKATTISVDGTSGSADTLALGSSGFALTLTGSGTPLNLNGADGLDEGTSSVVEYVSSSGATITGTTYYNLRVTPSTASSAVTYTLGGDIIVNGTAANALTITGANFQFSVLDTSANHYDITLGSGGLNLGNASVYGQFGKLITNDSTISTVGLTLNGGTITQGSSSITTSWLDIRAQNNAWTPGSGTLTLNGLGAVETCGQAGVWCDAQGVDVGNVTIANVILAATDVKAKSVAINVNKSLTINDDVLTLTGSGAPLTIGGGGLLQDNANSTVEYAATSGATTVNARTYAGGLKINGSGGTFDTGGSLTVTGLLTTSAGTFRVGTSHIVTAGNVTVDGTGTFSMPNSGGQLKLASGGTFQMNSTTAKVATSDVATAPILTTSGVEGTNFYTVNVSAGELDVAEWDIESVDSSGVQIGSSATVTLTAFNKVRWGGADGTWSGQAGAPEILLKVTGQTKSLLNHVFPTTWSNFASGDCNVQANTSGTVTMWDWSGGFGGENNDCDNSGEVIWKGGVGGAPGSGTGQYPAIY